MERQPKNIIACSDGTGNTAIKGRGSNVFKLYEAIALNDGDVPKQVAIYDDGIGTQSFRLARGAAGAFGYGLKRNVRQLYIEICRAYEAGDNIYLFGFSRGAFTVRMLAGLIVTQGIIDCQKVPASKMAHYARAAQRRLLHDHIKQAMLQKIFGAVTSFAVKRWRYDYREEDFIHYDKSTDARVDHGPHKETGVEVTFVGAWDTVDAVGFPVLGLREFWNTIVYKFRFPDQLLHKRVRAAAHALAIDDQRATFHPTMWDETECGEHGDHRINQVWFAGVHSNIGGGYPKQGMSLVALDWMMGQAKTADPESPIRFDQVQVELVKARANVDDLLYDSRASVSKFYRYSPREIESICKANNIPVRIHHSALYRAMESRTAAYSPGNLPNSFTVVGNSARSSAIPTGEVELRGPSGPVDFAAARHPWDTVRKTIQILVLSVYIPLMAWCIWFFDRGSNPSAWDQIVPCSGAIDCFWDPLSNNEPVSIGVGIFTLGTYAVARYASGQSNNNLLELWQSTQLADIQTSEHQKPK